MDTAYDAVGQELRPGDMVAHVHRHGSTVSIDTRTLATVLNAEEGQLFRPGGIGTRTASPSRVRFSNLIRIGAPKECQ